MNSGQSTLILVQAAHRGDANALDTLLRRYWPRIVRVLAIEFPHMQVGFADVEDLAQETLAEAVTHLSDFQGSSPGAFAHWVYTIARHKAIDHYRRENADRRGSGRVRNFADDRNPKMTTHGGVAAAGSTPSQGAVGLESEARLRYGLQQIQQEEREIFLMVREFGMSYEEVAETLGCPNAKAASKRFHRALASLVKWL
ncbi:MAG: hypothetical protein DWQ01_15135 [Planctomycetota bacterium]|nr:MAG: hypothetical protein DWQ01_15135 [Planctomycetota bacterium]